MAVTTNWDVILNSRMSEISLKDFSCCVTSGDICTQLYELESTNGVSKSRNSPINAASFSKHRSDWSVTSINCNI